MTQSQLPETDVTPDTVPYTALAAYLREIFGAQLLAGAVTGSRACGWATTHSDYDLIAIISPDSDVETPLRRYQAGVFQGVPTETLVVTIDEARRICDLRAAPRFWFTKGDDILRMEKFTSAKVLIGAPLWSTLLAACSPADYAAKRADRHWRIAAKFFDDLCGALDKGDADLAVDACRAMLREEVEALLCRTGDTNGRRKWMARRIARATGISTEIKTDFRRFHYLFDLSGETDLLPWVQSAIGFHHALQSAVLSSSKNDVNRTGHGGTVSVPTDLHLAGPLFLWQIDRRWLVKSDNGELALPEPHVTLLLSVMGGQGRIQSSSATLAQDLIEARLLRTTQSAARSIVEPMTS
ncbi:hypothetical protein [Phaeobacter sp.]|uniref:hypothetical protein n=1 Tax=Phaeobacter sp. TaxID=1902409 RepID=UPI0025FF39A9|nr:hypothetical protein [Phaeobacter sp.]